MANGHPEVTVGKKSSPLFLKRANHTRENSE
jgi:hypothetical protein